MITEQQVIAQMRQVMTQIESSDGEAQKRHLAKLMGFCELLLAEGSEGEQRKTSMSSVQPEAKQPLDQQMAAFLGIPLEEEKPKSESLLDF